MLPKINTQKLKRSFRDRKKITKNMSLLSWEIELPFDPMVYS